MHCIFLLPETDQLPQLQWLRDKYDPLAGKIPPHITLVFPGQLDGDRTRLAALLDRQAPSLPIRFSLGAPVAQESYLYFPLVEGRAQVAALNDALYAALPPGLRADIPYHPHLTFGRLGPGQDAAAMLREAEAVLPCSGLAGRMVLERIGADDESIFEHEVRGAFTCRLLDATDREPLQNLHWSAPGYSLIVHGHLPPGKSMDDKFVLGIFLDGRLVGCAEVLRGYPEPEVAYIGLLLFAEAHQGQGLGRKALGEVFDLAAGWGCGKVQLAVIASNRRAHAFWSREGFTELRRKQVPKVTGEAIVMQRLNPALKDGSGLHG